PKGTVRHESRIAVDRDEDLARRQRSGCVHVGKAPVGGRPTPGKEIGPRAAAGESQAQEKVIGGSSTIRSLRSEGKVTVLLQRVLQKLEVNVGGSAVAEPVRRNNHPDVALRIRRQVKQNIADVSLRGGT